MLHDNICSHDDEVLHFAEKEWSDRCLYKEQSISLSLSLSTLDSVFPNQRKAGTAGAQEQTKRICSSDASSSDFRFFDDHVKDKENSTPFADNKLKMK